MKLAALLDEKNILIHMQAGSMEDAIRQLVESLKPALGPLNIDRICERLQDVEQDLGAMPLGGGVRIPHARIGGLERMLIALGTSAEGVPLAPEDPENDERAHLIFLVLTPKTQSSVMLQTLAAIARLVSIDENRKALFSTTTPVRALRILEESGIEVKKAIVAADLMNPAEHRATPTMTLREVVEQLALSREEGIPVVDPDSNELLGDISSRLAIEVGLPPYMNLISDPRLLTDFEPFESFYKKEDSQTAGEIMNRDILRLAPETPVEILGHEMVAKACERAYVENDKKQLLGVVYRKDIIRKVLYL